MICAARLPLALGVKQLGLPGSIEDGSRDGRNINIHLHNEDNQSLTGETTKMVERCERPDGEMECGALITSTVTLPGES